MCCLDRIYFGVCCAVILWIILRIFCLLKGRDFFDHDNFLVLNLRSKAAFQKSSNDEEEFNKHPVYLKKYYFFYFFSFIFLFRTCFYAVG